MSSQEWRDRIRRFQANDQLQLLIIALAVMALIVHESLALLTGGSFKAVADGPIARILLGLICAMTFMKTRQTGRDVVEDTKNTIEVKETVQEQVATTLRDVQNKVSADDNLIRALESEHARTIQTLLDENSKARHTVNNLLANAQHKIEMMEHQMRDLATDNAKLEQKNAELVRQLGGKVGQGENEC